jgi:hypothetical protein
VTGYDIPEGYAIAKDGKMYYAFFTKGDWKGEIELRGLKPGKISSPRLQRRKRPRQCDAAANGTARFPAQFTDHLLLEVAP